MKSTTVKGESVEWMKQGTPKEATSSDLIKSARDPGNRRQWALPPREARRAFAGGRRI